MTRPYDPHAYDRWKTEPDEPKEPKPEPDPDEAHDAEMTDRADGET